MPFCRKQNTDPSPLIHVKEGMVPTPAPFPHRSLRTLMRSKAGERTGMLLLTVLYCFAISHVASTNTDAQFQGEQRPSLGISFSDASDFSLCPTSASESLVNSLNAPFSSASKDLTKGFAASIRLNDRSLRTTFTQHVDASRAVILTFWRAAILFPFHVFW